MATLTFATDANKDRITASKLIDALSDLNLALPPDHVSQWHDIVASVQESIDVVDALPDYFPSVDQEKYPRLDVHRPKPEDNKGNAWAWKAHIAGPEAADSRSPLYGVTVCLKDNIAVKDVPMLLGTDMFTGYTPSMDATVVTRLLEAGATIVGKAVCKNLSLCASSFSAATGPVEKPYAIGYTTGGSSSGCGHLVGIDDRRYAAPLPTELPDYSAGLGRGVRGLRIGLLKEAFSGFDGILDPRVKAKVLSAADVFRYLGAEVVEVSVPLHTVAGHIVNCALRLAASQQAYLGKACGRRGLYMTDLMDKMCSMDQAKFDEMFATPKFSMLSGLYLWKYHPTLYGKAMNLYRRLADDYNAALCNNTVDVLITPTTPTAANRHAAPNAGPLEQMNKSRGVAINTVCFNASGHPAMSIPVGFLAAKDDAKDEDDASVMLPVGMQIVGRMFDEAMVYRVGAAWEAACDWKAM